MTTRLGNASTARRRTSMKSLIGLLSVVALVAGCACSAASPPVHTDPTVAVIRHVIAQDNTFGGGGNPFSRVVVDPKRADGASLSAATKAAIVSELADLGDVEVSASKVLDGEASAYRDAVLLNAAAALTVAGKAGDLREGVAMARESIDAGVAREKVACLARATQAA